MNLKQELISILGVPENWDKYDYQIKRYSFEDIQEVLEEIVEKITKKADNSTVLEKPTPEKYGWHEQQGFDDEPSGWMFEGGEEAYYEALKKWEAQQ